MEQQSLETCEDSRARAAGPRVYSRTFKAGLLASGRFLTTCATLAILAVLARVLTVRDYATYRQTILAYQFAAPLLALGLPQALYYFLPGEKRRARAVLLENLLLLSGMGAVFSLFLLLGGNKLLASRFHNPALAKTLIIFAPYPLFMLPASALSACLMARDRFKQVPVFNVVSRLLMLVLVVTGCLVWRTPSAALMATVGSAAIVLFPAVKLMLASCKEGSARPTTSGMWTLLRYSVPVGIAGMLGAISLSLDKVIVSSMCTAEEFAVYANGAIEIPLIGIITGSVMAVILPDMVRSFKRNEPAEIVSLWQRSMAKCLMLLAPVMVFILVMAPQIMRVLFSSRYSGSSYPFRVYALMLPLRATSFGSVLMATGHPKLVTLYVGACVLFNAVLSVLLVGALGPIGAAWATALSEYLGAALATVMIVRILREPISRIIEWKRLGRILASVSVPALVIVGLGHYMPRSDMGTLLISGLLFMSVLGLIYDMSGVFRFRDARRAWRALGARRK